MTQPLGNAKTVVPPEDHPEIEQRYRGGETLQEIGDSYGVSRERIRQILSRMDVSAKEGGASKQARERRAMEAADRKLKCLRRYGMTPSRFYEVQRNVSPQGNTPLQCYKQQEANAGRRGIPWRFNFASWWDVWERSGKWSERGRGTGYVMSRPGDEGPYEPGNVRIVPGSENNSEYINRYWYEVHAGIRPEPANNTGKPRGSKHGFHKLESQPSIVIQHDDVRRLQSQAFTYARQWGWEISTEIEGDRLKVTRVA